MAAKTLKDWFLVADRSCATNRACGILYRKLLPDRQGNMI
jgi:hypothetical protein